MDGQGGYTLNGDSDPLNDVCAGSSKMQMNFTPANMNVGNLLNNAGFTWGWFQGGFDLTVVNPNGTTGCSRSTVSPITGLTEADYVPHHEPFQFYPSTANPNHTRPTSVATIGPNGDAANHQYDLHDFFDALNAGHLAACQLPQSAVLSERPCRQLQSAGRTGLCGQRDQHADAIAVLEHDGGDHRL